MEKKTVQTQTQQAQTGQRPGVFPEEDTIDLLELFFCILHGWKGILLAMLIGAVAFGGYHHFLVKPSYQADAMIYITNTESVITFSDLQMSAALTQDYAMIIKSRTVLNRVIDELALDIDYRRLSRLITVENPDKTHIIHIIVTCDNLEMARNIANALMNVGIDQIYQTIGTGQPNIIDASEAEAVEEVTPGILKYMMIGAMLGALIVCVIITIKMLTNTTIKTEDDVEKYLHIPVLAAVPYYQDKNRRKG